MLFLLSKELWQGVRHCARKAEMQSDLWYWTTGDFGGDVRLRSLNGDRTLSSLIEEATSSANAPVAVIAAGSELSGSFERVIECLVRHPGDLRISLMLTTPLDESRVEECKQFLRSNEPLRSRVSSFFMAARKDMEMQTLRPAEVTERYTCFLRLLCQGGESLADSLGIFRSSFQDDVADLEDVQGDRGVGMDPEVSVDRFSPFPGSKGIVAALGLRSWIPEKEKIVNLTESLLAKLVAEEEKRAAIGTRVRSAEPSLLIHRALYLGQADEPLGSEDFAEQIPDPPASPLQSWKVPVSRERARKERRHLQRVVQRDFAEYTEALKASLDEITTTVYDQSNVSFQEASQAYRGELLNGIEMGGLSLLVRNYFPAFDSDGETPLAGPEGESKGWLPHESLDCFSQVYDTLEEGLDQLPTRRIWKGIGVVALVMFAAAFMYRDSEAWVPIAFASAGLLIPFSLWLYRVLRLRTLRKQLVAASDNTFWGLRQAFDEEVQWIIQRTRVQLERDIRKDATSFGARLQHQFDTIPWLTTVANVEHDGIQEEIRKLRSSLLGIGVDETRLDRMTTRLEDLASRIVEEADRDPLPEGEVSSTPTPAETLEEWLDELVGTAILPLGRVEHLKDEILETAGGWRLPPLMAPVTDAEMHRGFRKVMVIPDTDIVYQQLEESLPRFSGNPVINLDVWTGPVPGVATCSVMTGLTDSIFDSPVRAHHGNGNGNGVFSEGR